MSDVPWSEDTQNGDGQPATAGFLEMSGDSGRPTERLRLDVAHRRARPHAPPAHPIAGCRARGSAFAGAVPSDRNHASSTTVATTLLAVEVLKQLGSFGRVEGVGLKRVRNPLGPLGVFRMARVAERREEFRITVNTSDILKRPGSLPADTARVRFLGERRKDGLDHNAVLPPIAEVIDVGEFAPLSEAEVAEAYPPGVFGGLVRTVVGIWFGKPPVPQFEPVEVRVGPAHCVLNDEVKRIKRRVAEDSQPSPDRRFRLRESDL
jgi:hypothetical protein